MSLSLLARFRRLTTLDGLALIGMVAVLTVMQLPVAPSSAMPARAASIADEEPKPKTVAADEAKEYVGKKATFEMTVKSSRNVEASKVYFLNSEPNYRDEKNLALVIEYAAADAFKKAGIEDPADYYKDKTIRVTGTVTQRSEQYRIRVTEPSQIEVVKK